MWEEGIGFFSLRIKLFCGNNNAAKNRAFAYSLTESCKLNNINPYDYWSDLIDFVGCKGGT